MPPTNPVAPSVASRETGAGFLDEYAEPDDGNERRKSDRPAKILGAITLLVIAPSIGIYASGYSDEVIRYGKNFVGYVSDSQPDGKTSTGNPQTVTPTVPPSPSPTLTEPAAILTPLECVQKTPVAQQVESRTMIRITGDGLPAVAKELQDHRIGFVSLSTMPQDLTQIKAFKNIMSNSTVVLLEEKAVVYGAVPLETPAQTPAPTAANTSSPTASATVEATPAPTESPAVPAATETAVPTTAPTDASTESAPAPTDSATNIDLAAAASAAEKRATELRSQGIDGVVVNWADLRQVKDANTSINDPAALAEYAKVYALAYRQAGMKYVITEGFTDSETPEDVTQDMQTTYKLPGFFDTETSVNGSGIDDQVVPALSDNNSNEKDSNVYSVLREHTGDDIPLFSDPMSKQSLGEKLSNGVLDVYRSGADVVKLQNRDGSEITSADITSISKAVLQAVDDSRDFEIALDTATLRVMKNGNIDPCGNLPQATPNVTPAPAPTETMATPTPS
jgi:hypothetical protein